MGTYGLVHLDHFGLHLVLWSTSSLGQLLLDSCVRLVPFHLGGQVIADEEIRVVVRKKTGLCGENSQVADPPPVWETPVIKKKVGFYFSF